MKMHGVYMKDKIKSKQDSFVDFRLLMLISIFWIITPFVYKVIGESVPVRADSVTGVLHYPTNFNYGTLRSVRDFGAAGNGSTDDAAALQRAITSGSVYIPKGTNQAPATNIFTTTGTFSNNQTVTVGESVYTLKSSLTAANEYEVAIGASTAITLTNLANAINGGPGEGTTYGTSTPPNASTRATPTTTTLILRAMVDGSTGNGVATTETCANASFSTATLTNGVDSYKLSTNLVVPSNRLIMVEPGTVLCRNSATVQTNEVVLLRNSDTTNGNKNIAVVGGVWDGNGFNQTRVDSQIQAVFKFVKVDNALFQDLQIKNPLVFATAFGDLTNSKFKNIGFYQDRYILNGDGLHFCGGCDNVEIDGVWGMTNDDMIALVAYENSFFTTGLGDIKNFVIKNVYSNGGHRGIRLLSAAGYFVDGITIRNVRGNFTHGGIIIGNNAFGETSLISNVLIDGANLEKCTGPAAFGTTEASIYVDCNTRNLTFKNITRTDDIYHAVVQMVTGYTYQDTLFENLEIYSGTNNRVNVVLAGTHKNLTFRDSTIKYTGGSSTGGIFIRGESGLTITKLLLDNVNTEKMGIVYRDNSAANTVTDLEVINCNLLNSDSTFYFDNASTAISRMTFKGTNVKTVSERVIFDGGVSISNITFDDCSVDTSPYVIYLSGSLGANPKIWFSGLKTSTISSSVIGKSASQAYSLNTFDYPYDSTLLTPVSGDIVNDSTYGLSRYNGSSWDRPGYLGSANTWTGNNTFNGTSNTFGGATQNINIATSSGNVTFSAGGSASNIEVDIKGKGTGSVLVISPNNANYFNVSNAAIQAIASSAVSADFLSRTLSAGAWNASTSFSTAGTLSGNGAPDAANAVWLTSSSIVAEGSSADTSETTISFTNPTADRTITIPDATGTIFLDGNDRTGTTTNNDAAAGKVGEIVSSFVASGSAVSLTTATAANVTSISLTAGDWDVDGNVNFIQTAATITVKVGSISTTSATNSTDGSEVYSGALLTVGTANDGLTLPRKRISISGTTTVYLVTSATFSAGTVTAFGGITARRVR